jgi:hypothetical protein
MYSYTIGGKNGKKYMLYESSDMVAIRTWNSRKMKDAVTSLRGKEALKDFDVVMEFPEADITVYRIRESAKNEKDIRDKARSALKKEPELRFVGKVLVEADDKTMVLYTENIFIKFHDDVDTGTCEKILSEKNLIIKQKPEYARNAYFVSTPENTGLKVFKIAGALLDRKEVELCHPELIRKRGFKWINPEQWHLMTTKINGKKINAGVKADLAHK